MTIQTCAGWFCGIKEENAAEPGRSSSGGRVLSADRSGAEIGEAFDEEIGKPDRQDVQINS